MSSDEDMYLVEEILNQRKRKKGLEYLVRWKGYSELFDTWEPAAAVAHCTLLIQNFLNQKKSGSKSRSRSGGRIGTKSRSRSRSRGRPPKSRSARSRSRSRSASRTVAQPAASASISVKAEEATVADLKPPSLRSRPRREQWSEQRSSAEKADVVLEKASTSRDGATWNRKTEMLTASRSVETVRSTPPRTQPVRAVPDSSMAVRQVLNDQKPTSRDSTSTGGGTEETCIWWLVDYATLAVFALVALCVLAYSLDSFSGVVPSASVLSQRLGESYNLLVQELSYVFRAVYEGCDRYTDGCRNVLNWLSASHSDREGQNQTGGQPSESGKV